MEFTVKYKQICNNPPAILYGGTNNEPLASIGMARFFQPIGNKFKDGIKVLDYGCGAGILCNYLSGQLTEFEYYGIEPNVSHGRERIQLANQYFNDPRCKFGFIDTDYHSIIQKHLDVIVLISVFTHMEMNDIEEVLNELCQVFKYNPNCDIVFSCFIDTHPRVVLHQPNIWDRFYGESYITYSFLEIYCERNNLKMIHDGEFIAQGNYKHQIIKISKT